jgi:YidC/Oxa1 family membrane protein insertase
MDRNMMMVILISVAVVFGFQYFVNDYISPKTPKTDAAKTDEKASAGKSDKAASGAVSKTAPKATPKAVPEAKAMKAKAEKTIAVETDLYKAVLSSKGATVRQITLRNYNDNKGKRVAFIADEKLPALAIGSDDGLQYAGADFEVSGSDIKLDDKKKNADITFVYRSGAVSIKRTFTFNQGDYAIKVRDQVNGHDSYFVSLGKDFGIFDKENLDHPGPILLRDTELIAFSSKELKSPGKPYNEKVKWIAQEDKYFASMIVPQGAVEEARTWSMEGNALIGFKMKGGDNSFLLYTGPKDIGILEQYKAGMEHIVDFGYFSIIARPLFWLLQWINSMVGNYGWSIILFTIITRVPLIPLMTWGQRSMKKMADIQPKMTEIREKFKNDPQKMQKELMDMYKKNKINPVGGCLPMLLQIPFFIALFAILSTAIELRHAPFIWWITDLAGPDNYFSERFGLPFVVGPLPLLMGASMFLQQKMTPTSADPMQAKMMLILPVIFTFMFLSFSSGLVLFWLVSNILSIIQQFYINKQMDAQKQS